MSRYIDADLLLDDLGIGSEEARTRGEIITAEDIDRIPTADVQEVKHGHWVSWAEFFGDSSEDNSVFCSCCSAYSDFKSFYCHHCGAKMDGDSDV